jgi:hypothetical protein
VAAQLHHPSTRETTEADEGTAAHALGEDLVKYIRSGVSAGELNRYRDTCGQPAEVFDAAELYATTVGRVQGSLPAGHAGLEERVECPDVHPECFGTVDAWAYDRDTWLHVFDFKYGRRLVEVVGNLQLLIYASGLLRILQAGGLSARGVKLHVVQPRAFHPDGPVRTWSTTAEGLVQRIDYVRAQAARVYSPEPSVHSGPHCRDCAARHNCTAAGVAAANSVDVAHGYEPRGNPTPEAVGVELSVLKRAQKALEYRVAGLEEHARALARSGQSVPGWHLVESRGRLAWDVPPDHVATTGDALGLDLRRAEVITPTQAKAAGMPEELVKQMASRPSRGMKLEPVDTNKARYVFSGKE